MIDTNQKACRQAVEPRVERLRILPEDRFEKFAYAPNQIDTAIDIVTPYTILPRGRKARESWLPGCEKIVGSKPVGLFRSLSGFQINIRNGLRIEDFSGTPVTKNLCFRIHLMRADIALCDANEAFASSDGGHFTQLFDKWEMRGVTPIVEKYEENCFYSELGKNEADIFNVDNFRQSGFNGRISNEVGRMRDP